MKKRENTETPTKRLWADESFDKKRDNTTTSNQAPFANNPLRRKHSKQQKGEGRAAQDPLPLSVHLRRDDALQRRSAATLRLTLSLALPPPPCTALRRRLPRGGVVLAAGPAAATAAATATPAATEAAPALVPLAAGSTERCSLKKET